MLKAIAAVVLLSSVASAAFAEPLTIKPKLEKKKEAENLSGAACARPGKACLLVSDEMRFARQFKLDGNTLRLADEKEGKEPVVLLPGGGDETDAEGIAYWNGAYYLTGSHGLSKGGEAQLSRFHVYSAPVSKKGKVSGPVVVKDGLRDILKTTAPFSDHAEKPLAEHGVNIEGLAVADGMAFFAFRGPVLDGKALVLRVSLDALFGAKAPDAKSLAIRTAAGIGLRDIAAVKGGFLLLTGPEADVGGPADIRFWDGRSETAGPPLAVAHSEDAKPEALLVLGETKAGYDLIILSDGASGGDPERLTAPKAVLRPAP